MEPAFGENSRPALANRLAAPFQALADGHRADEAGGHLQSGAHRGAVLHDGAGKAHGFVEDGGDKPALRIAGRIGGFWWQLEPRLAPPGVYIKSDQVEAHKLRGGRVVAAG